MTSPRVLTVVGVMLIGLSVGMLLQRTSPRTREDRLRAAVTAADRRTTPVVRFFRNPEPLPDFTLTDIDGRPLTAASLRGKVTIINFWATWCPPCRAEISDLVALQEKYKDTLQIVGISQDETPDAAGLVRGFVDARHINYRVALGTRDIERTFPGVDALPTSYVVDKNGRVVQLHVGMLSPSLTELEVRALAGLPVDAPIERIDAVEHVASR